MTPDLARKVSESEQKYFSLPAQQRSDFLEQLRASQPDVAAALTSRLGAARVSASETVDYVSQAEIGVSSPTTDYTPPSHAELPEQIGRYTIDCKLGEGGMGVVYRGRDPDLQRFLAIKIVKQGRQHDVGLCRRFLEEAQVMGRLQHPGIAPIHEIGTLDDGRPFFSMKQIQGKTLADLLKERQDPATDLPRFVGIFEQVCQTLAYAHSQGIIHRDLKPANVMVGAFGEVQVMDWGLAKRMKDDGGRMKDGIKHVHPSSFIPHPSDETQAGVAMGTPAYMAPEQARGEIAELDERADVFGLGAVLCEILTGKPPFCSPVREDVFAMARRGDLHNVLGRLDACGADVELIDLCKRCLAPQKEDRPPHACEVAEAVECYQEQVQERLRQAELRKRAAEVQAQEEVKRREVEQAKVREERKRRRVQLALGVVLLILLVGVGAAALWYQDYLKRTAVAQREQEIERQKKELQNQQDIQQLGNFLAKYRQIHDKFDTTLRKKDGVFELQNRRQEWTEKLQLALATLSTRGKELLARIDGTERQAMAKQLADLQKKLHEDQTDWQIAARLGQIRDRRITVVDNEFDYKYVFDHYPDAFRNAVAGFFDDDVEIVARRVRSMRIQDQVIASIYDWCRGAFVHELKTTRPNEKEPYRALRGRLLAIVKLLDRSPWAAQLQDPGQWGELMNNQLALKDMIESMPPHVSPHFFSLIGDMTMVKSQARRAWLQLASSRYAHDFGINFDIATKLDKEGSPSEAIGYFRAAANINRFNSAMYAHWGNALHHLENYDEAIVKYKKATKLDPNLAAAYTNWGNALHHLENYDEAIAKYQRATSVEPGQAEAYYNWGNALADLEKYDQAIVKYQKATAIQPDFASAYLNCGHALAELKRYKEAIVKYQQATSIQPDYANAYHNWGDALRNLNRYDKAIAKYKMAISFEPNHAKAFMGWGDALRKLKNYDEAIAKYRKATSIEPKNANAYSNWGLALQNLKRYDEAIVKYRKATSIEANDANVYNTWGVALAQLKRYNEAIVKFKKATSIEPSHASAYVNWGLALQNLKRYDEAIAKYKKATSFNSGHANAFYNWGNALAELQRCDEAIVKYKRAICIDPNHAQACTSLGHALAEMKRYEEATSALKRAIRLQRKSPNPRFGLGVVLFEQGNFREAMASFRMVTQLVSARHSMNRIAQSRIKQCQLWLSCEKQLPAVLTGKQKVSVPEKQLAMAVFCVRYKKRYRDAVTLYKDLFEREPKLAESFKYQDRYNAACAAALAAAGKGKAAAEITDKQRSHLRQQALTWLRADHNAYVKWLKTQPTAAMAIQNRLKHWQNDADLASVREAKPQAALPAAERKAWQKLWADVVSLQKQARSSYVETKLEGELTDAKRQQAHEVKLKAGKTYVIDMHSKQFDTYLKLHDGKGKLLDENDDIDTRTKNRNSRLTFTPKTTAVYRLLADSYEQKGRGSYVILIREFRSK